MMNFFFGMLVMYFISGICWMYEDVFAPSNGWYTSLPDIFYTPLTIFFKIICIIVCVPFVALRHPIIFIKYFIKKIKKILDK